MTIPRDGKNPNILGDDWRVRKRVAYHRISIRVAKEYLWDFRNTKQNTRDHNAARCEHKMKVGKSKPDAKIDIKGNLHSYNKSALNCLK